MFPFDTDTEQPNTGDTASLTVGELVQTISEARLMLAAVMAELDPRNIPVAVAPEVLSAFVGVERLAANGRMLIASRAAKATEWQRQGFASAADWLAAQQGTSATKARGDLETSNRLEGLDDTSEAMKRGDVSPDQAAAISDAAAVNPDAEKDLLDVAENESFRQLGQQAARRKAQAEAELSKRERERKIRQRRSATVWYRDGEGFLRAQGPATDIRRLEQDLNDLIARRMRAAKNGREREKRNAIAFDALLDLASGGAGGPGATGGAGGSKKNRPRAMMLIRCDLAALLRGGVSDGEVCEIAGVGPISISAARELLGNSALMLLLANGETVVDVVNLSRKPTVAQEIVRLWTTPTCSVQGCDRGVGLEFDHRNDWAVTRVTVTDELDPLCGHHHDQKTRHGWTLDPGTGRRPMRSPTDRARWNQTNGTPSESRRSGSAAASGSSSGQGTGSRGTGSRSGRAATSGGGGPGGGGESSGRSSQGESSGQGAGGGGSPPSLFD